MEKKYGVNTFVKDVYINEVDFDETFKLPDYKYVIEIIEIDSYNGNGLKEMKIYTEGKLVELSIGNWKISPIVRLPFDWSGYRPQLETIDKGKYVHKHECRMGETVYHTIDYKIMIQWVFDTIRELEIIENVRQLKLYDCMSETRRLLNIYKNGTNLQIIKKFIERLNYEYVKLLELKDNLSKEGYQNTMKELNSNFDLFNEVKLNRLSDN
jgi:hypothetical protein